MMAWEGKKIDIFITRSKNVERENNSQKRECVEEREREGKKEGHMDAIEGRWTDDVIFQSGYRAPGKAATTHKTCFFFLKYIQTPSTQHINWSACFWDTPRQVKNLCSMVMVKCSVKLILQTEGVILADWMVIEDFSLRAHTHTPSH